MGTRLLGFSHLVVTRAETHRDGYLGRYGQRSRIPCAASLMPISILADNLYAETGKRFQIWQGFRGRSKPVCINLMT